MPRKTTDTYTRWEANHQARQAACQSLPYDETQRYFHLLILELQGEVSIHRFKLCLDAAMKQLQKDREWLDAAMKQAASD